MNTIAAIGVALHEAASSNFVDYAHQVVLNARILSRELVNRGFNLATGGTDSHLLLINLQDRDLTGNTVAEGLERAGIVANRNSIPNDPAPFYPSGLRLGTPAITSRGMRDSEMKEIGLFIADVVDSLDQAKRGLGFSLEEERKLASRIRIIEAARVIPHIREQVLALCRRFPPKEAYI